MHKELKQSIIGISGYKGSGKDTVCSLLHNSLSSTFKIHRFAFADSLKDEVCSIFKCTRDDIEKDKEKWRVILQDYGQRAKESRGEMVWITEVAKKIQLASKLEGQRQLIIITDVRFPFEAKWLQELGGFLVKIERFDSNTDTHISETSVDQIHNVDYFLPNKGKLGDLEREVRWLAAAIKERYNI